MNAIALNYKLSHKIQLDPTMQQEKYFKKACGIARFTWNWALAEWQRQYTSNQKPNGLKLKKEFNALKLNEFPWIYEVTKYASQQPFIYLQSAFQRFFRKESKFPRFKKKGIHDSFYIGNDQIKIKGKQIKIPKLGWIRLREVLRFSGKLVAATISRIADKWFVSVQMELEEKPKACESQASVGVDLGILQLATLFDGKCDEQVEGRRPLKRLISKLKRAQRRLSAKQPRSKNREKARMKVARLHYRIRCIRQDGLHKLTSDLTRRYKTIIIEDLNVKGMLSNRRLSRAISDMGFYEFKRQLEYKALLYGNEIKIADRYFPSSKRCSQCGNHQPDLSLKDRLYQCPQCGLSLDRDMNAARNLWSTASSAGFKACGEEGAGSSNYV